MTALRNFHEGEVRLQAESGVDSETFDEMVHDAFQPELSRQEVRFVSGRTFSVAATIDAEGRPWASPLFGTAGELFRVIDLTTVRLTPPAADGDPAFDNVQATGELGILYFDPARRRRQKSMGRGELGDDGSVIYRMRRNFGLCNKYIFKRSHEPAPLSERETPADRQRPQLRDHLDADDRAQLETSDTVFLASFHVDHGADPTHRGGPAGFVRVIDDGHIEIPDYTGNGMFQTLGNVLLDDRIGLMTVDFATGRTVHATGRAAIIQSPDSDPFSTRTLAIAVDEVRTSWHQTGTWTDVEAFELRPGLVNPGTPFL